MAPKRDLRRDQAYEIYKQHGGKIANRQIAEILDVPEKTIGSWKSVNKDNWEAKLAADTNGVLQSQERSTPIEKGGTSPPQTKQKPVQPQGVPKLKEHDLSLKQRLFVQEYIVDLNGTQAAIRAGYKAKNARVQAAQLLAKLNIRQAVRQAMADRIERTQINQDWVLERLVKLASYNLRDFANLAIVRRIFETKSGDVLEDEIQTVVLNPDFDGTIAKSLYQDKDGIKLDMPDRVRALELIGKHVGMFGGKHRIEMDRERLALEKKRVEIEEAKQNGGAEDEKAKAWSDAVKRMDERRKKREQQQGGDTP